MSDKPFLDTYLLIYAVSPDEPRFLRAAGLERDRSRLKRIYAPIALSLFVLASIFIGSWKNLNVMLWLLMAA